MRSAPILLAWPLCLQFFQDAVSPVPGRATDFRGELRTVTASEELAAKYGMSKQFEKQAGRKCCGENYGYR